MIEPIKINEIFEMAKDRHGQHANRATVVSILRHGVNKLMHGALSVLNGGQGLDNLRRLEAVVFKLARKVHDHDEADTWVEMTAKK